MAVIKVENFGEDELKRLYIELTNKGDWIDECTLCRMPLLIHRGSCTRKACSPEEYGNSWQLFKRKMKPVINWYEDDQEKKREKDNLYQIIRNQNDMLSRIVNITENNNKGTTGTTTKLIKPAKVPSWSKGMRIDSYKKSLEVWMENNKELPQAIRYQEVIESLKMNKEIEGLAVYIGEHIIGKLDTTEKQTVKNLVELLDIKYGRTRLEELEEMMEDWIKFNFNEMKAKKNIYSHKRN